MGNGACDVGKHAVFLRIISGWQTKHCVEALNQQYIWARFSKAMPKNEQKDAEIYLLLQEEEIQRKPTHTQVRKYRRFIKSSRNISRPLWLMLQGYRAAALDKLPAGNVQECFI